MHPTSYYCRGVWVSVGVGVPAGCEAIVRALNSVLNDSSVPSRSKLSLLVDFSNGFNCINREMMFEEVRGHTPSMAAWMECCYGAQPLLHLVYHTILSCGVQQGDSLCLLGLRYPFIPLWKGSRRMSLAF